MDIHRNVHDEYENLYSELKKYLEKMKIDKVFSVSDFVHKFEKEFSQMGFRNTSADSVKNILIIRDDEIGDFVLTSGFIREIRRIYQQAEITLVVKSGTYNLAELCPYVNHIHPYDVRGCHVDGFIPVFNEIIKLCKDQLWQYKFDLCFCPRWEFDNKLPTLLGYVSGARERIGYSEIAQYGKKSNGGAWIAY